MLKDFQFVETLNADTFECKNLHGINIDLSLLDADCEPFFAAAVCFTDDELYVMGFRDFDGKCDASVGVEVKDEGVLGVG